MSSWVKDSGFRSDCGSPVPNVLCDTEYHWVPVGSLEGDGAFDVVSHIFVGSSVSWCGGGDSFVEHVAFPDAGIESHIKMLNE